MITLVQPLPIGNAVRFFLDPPATAVRWRVLRKESDTIVSEADPDAVAVYAGNEKSFVDSSMHLVNGTQYFYQPFYTVDGSTWSTSVAAAATPVASYEEFSTDAFTLLRQRLEQGFSVEVQRGNIASELGYVQVFPAPPGLNDDLRFPLITIHLESEDRGESAVGEYIGGDDFNADDGNWDEHEGWLSSVRIQIATWSLNADERVEMRKALRRVVIANFPVFEDAGITTPSMDMSDVDYLNGEFGAPVYQTMANFSCLAPVRVGGKVDAVLDVTVTLGGSNG